MTSSPPAIDLSSLDLSGIAEIARVCTVEIIGSLEPGDLTRQRPAIAETLGEAPPRPGVELSDLRDGSAVRARHHHIARLLASGMKQRMVATLCGYSESWISTLANAPSMRELIGYYQTNLNANTERMVQKLSGLADMAIEELTDKAAAGQLSPSELTAIAKLSLDRSGLGPSSSVHNLNETHIFDHAELRRRDKAARGASAERIIELPAPKDDLDPDNG